MRIQGSLKKKGIILLKLLSVAAVLLAVLPGTATGQGLLVMPRRVVFENGKRTQELNLANAGMDTARYTISLIDINMNDEGIFTEVTNPDSAQSSAIKNLRLFPRAVTLGPNEAQTIKVHVMNAGKLAPGEYRSHIYIKALPRENPEAKRMKKMVSNLSLKLTPMFGLTIPVIIRIGDYNGSVTISDALFEMPNDSSRINMVLSRNGTMSTYGNVAIDYLPVTGDAIRVGFIKGVSVYTPNKFRKLKLDLDKKENVDYRNGKLKITYNNLSGDRIINTAVKEIPLQQTTN